MLKMQLLLVLVSFISLTIALQSDPITIPITQTKLVRDDSENDIRGLEDITPVMDISLEININLTPGKDKNATDFTVSLSTLSSDLWIISCNCQSPFCKDKKSINVTTDNTTVYTTEAGLVSGYRASGENVLQVGLIPVNNINFIAADVVHFKRDSMSEDATGGLGLAPSNITNQISKPQGLFLYISGKREGSALYINGYPTGLVAPGQEKYKSNIKSLSKDSWLIDIDYITSPTASRAWCLFGCRAVIDTSYSGISGPKEEIDAINKHLGIDEDGNVDCFKQRYMQPVIFHIASGGYQVDPKNFITDSEDRFSTRCKSVFEADNSYSGQWRLGTAFLQQYLTLFSYSKESTISFLILDENKNNIYY